MKYVVKTLFWRIEVEGDGFTFRNMWGETSYDFGDIVSIAVKAKYYVIRLADTSIRVQPRTISNYLRFLDDAAYHGVLIES